MSAPSDRPPAESGRVLIEDRGAVRIMTLNRPERRNAIDTETAWALHRAIDELDERDDLTIAVITGAGDHFCAGMDLNAFLAGERPAVGSRGFAGIVEQPPTKPVIAAVEGAAVAGGFEIVLACDLVVASTTARFGLPEVKRGLVAAGGGLLRLPGRVPYARAMEWALTGDTIAVEEAERFGLVNRVTKPGGALAGALELAAAVARNGPLAVRATKQVIVESGHWVPSEAFERQLAYTMPVRSSADAVEGARAFAEKRAPIWTGR